MFKTWLLKILKRKIVADCGHETLIRDKVSAFGETITTELPIENGKTPYCHRCIEKMAIRCAWCGRPIFIGDPVTLYSPVNKNFKMPDYAIIYNKEHNSYVGCLRWDCAETSADRMGFWYPPGKVIRVPSPIEMAIQSGGPVVVNDLSKLYKM